MKTKISIKQAHKWAAALRSGKYKQTRNALQTEDGYCCLGVACDLFIPNSKIRRNVDGFIFGSFPDAQTKSPKWLKVINNDLKKMLGTTLSILNDNKGFSFLDIANLIELVYIHNRDTDWRIHPTCEPDKND